MLALLGFSGSLAVVGQLYQLQMVHGAESLQKARMNTVVVERFNAPRGRIFDSKGRLIVTNEPEFQLEGVVAEMPNLKKAIPEIAACLHIPANKVSRPLRKAQIEGPLEPVTVAHGLTTEQVVEATTLVRRIPGLRLSIRERRRYIGPNMGAHMLGYTGEITSDELKRLKPKGYVALDRLGKEGLEQEYDAYLRGQIGLRQVAVDALGRTVRSQELRAPKPGAELVLNVDWHLQQVAEEALAEALKEVAKKNGERSGGSAIVMEARTGRIRALANLPQYDPRIFSRGIKSREYRKLLEDPGIPLVFRAISSAFSPGSTFKLINSSASLDEKLCFPNSPFYCGGSYAGANCFVRSGHGHINFEQSLAVSCDVVYYMLGVRLGVDRLVRHAFMFGLGRLSGIDIPGEVKGNLPTPAWKQKVWKDRWYEGDTVNLSIGQGFLLVTPIQMAVVTAAVANGGTVVRPHLVDKLVSYQGRVVRRISCQPARHLPYKAVNLAAVRAGMRGAVTYGTATAVNSPLVHVAGKTGTVENTPSRENPHGRNHTWFVSFAPYENPELVVVVFLEKTGGYGGSMAAPVARKVYDDYFAGRAHK